ncbi:MAG: hypothetical protein AAGF66_20735, partial [Cyanobacteria bacterium P01_H01_bin.119]
VVIDLHTDDRERILKDAAQLQLPLSIQSDIVTSSLSTTTTIALNHQHNLDDLPHFLPWRVINKF